ncbi:PP2C family protein-serine/threonine phosphatase [Streptomyces sp. SL13]|uniref:PP2C family protein-serine/threonine phosphatase n=1 Tax=Streptantibioticus silvisoli TaxID=2705255 RepID=A0AA90KFD6_9ACTN|nr:PP2C family protein-serine/threonine phosphatase [Streptantibioticus silvisoli]MDI5961674.1 PP2C family protein-serine/threonine phosphatase [Streptantibioticus silvisoli]MDI5968774.1 PP2C family protein-serine/threonine phosphatase [Streptantibioticus silvisoli]
MTEGGSGPGGERVRVDRSEGYGERLLGLLLDRAHEMPPQLIAPLVAEEVARMGGRDVTILLQDYEQMFLVPLPGPGLVVGAPEPVEDSPAGEAFLRRALVEVAEGDSVRMYLPLLDGSDQIGVMVVTLDVVDDDDRRLLRRLSALVADMIVTKDAYTDLFFQARRRAPMSVAAEIQWSLLPPLSMTTPMVEVAGILEPAYAVAGDSFDYALNDTTLHVAMIDAMGHGLDAATMATVAIGAYRHTRRADTELSEVYAFMDRAIAEQFGLDHFVTAQMMTLDVVTGRLRWVNAGHPAPLLIRNRVVAGRLDSPTTLPVGFGGRRPEITERALRRGDRVLCFTDGLFEEHRAGGETFGEEQLIEWTNRVLSRRTEVRAVVRGLSHVLKERRGGVTSDDATMFMIEWRGDTPDVLPAITDLPDLS